MVSRIEERFGVRFPPGGMREVVPARTLLRTPYTIEPGSTSLDMLPPCMRLSASPGRDPDLEFMGHLAEPLHVTHRPLFFYAATEALAGEREFSRERGLSTIAALPASHRPLFVYAATEALAHSKAW
jgi:hypothetical protein